MRIVTIDPKKCVGCRNCEYACSNNSAGFCDNKESNMKVNVYAQERAVVPMTCLHCEDAWCMQVCPAGAISRDEKTNAVIIDPTRCAGCKMCVLACPYGNIHFDKVKQVSRKCDLCGGEEPNCVKHCIGGALSFEEIEDTVDEKRKTVDSIIKAKLKK